MTLDEFFRWLFRVKPLTCPMCGTTQQIKSRTVYYSASMLVSAHHCRLCGKDWNEYS